MLWILVPIALVIIAIVIAFPVWFTHRRMRDDHDLASAEQYLDQIGKSHEDAALGRPAPPRQEAGLPGGPASPRGRHRAPETSQAETSQAETSQAEDSVPGPLSRG